MDESTNGGDKERPRQKPPLSRRRIAAEILVGMVVGFAAAELAKYAVFVAHSGAASRGDCFGIGVLVFLAMPGFLLIPPVYGLASGAGVYLVGRIGEQTGSFLLTLGCGLAGGLTIIGVRSLVRSFYWSYWLPSIPDWVFLPLLLLLPPAMATICFNLTRGCKRSHWS